MKPTFHRIRRKGTSKNESKFFKKEANEQMFFNGGTHQTFFQPSATVQRKCDKCEEEDKKLNRKSDKDDEKKVIEIKDIKKEEDEKKLKKKEASTSSSTASPVSYVSSLSGGSALPANTASFFSRRLGVDVSSVKIHTETEAAQSAAAVNAKAYTIGNDIVFAEGQFSPESDEGKKLLAHELVHVIQNNKHDNKQLQRKAHIEDETDDAVTFVQFEGIGSHTQNTRDHGCAGVSVQGVTDANYSNSFSSRGSQRRAATCTDCSGDSCITSSGTVVSSFSANPTVTLPAVPSGLGECETAAVRTFINTTLRNHELQHVAAFNTYRGTVRTPYSFTGCVSDLNAYIQSIHDGIEVPRRGASDAASAALDPFNVPIPCDCE